MIYGVYFFLDPKLKFTAGFEALAVLKGAFSAKHQDCGPHRDAKVTFFEKQSNLFEIMIFIS